ncbi:hypothetical protein KXD40_004026 [Peronospora effusa]|uniref:Kinetochore protein SPC25 n=1 Tax=Peronospora effusa TaxID=542832 RepID=A0A3M6VVM8_9STRA|nr:hypothetical protein DD238_000404 [Peronospora effusa]UIZ22902.1 hypothetical protein KXD40_004026 [Peronospora effusa]
MQEIWRSVELPAPLETDALVQQNLSTRTELEAWVEAQKTRILEEKRTDQLQSQEYARATDEAQRKREMLQIEHQKLLTDTHTKERELNASQMEIEVLQAEKSRREPVVKQLFDKTVEEDVKLKQLLTESQKQRTTQKQQLQELKQGLSMYQKLGLFFEHSKVDNCNEDVASLNNLVTMLNETGDLALFIRSMRRMFKQLV